ncbi:transglycosylase SLT domain-containing protein, partial [Pseudomonadota bacterium]
MILGLFVLPQVSKTALAHHLVETHKLDCGKTFPCPKQLQRRVDFWIKVFREWGTDQVILHDEKYPPRVYKVLRTGSTCRGRALRRHRNAVAADLRKISVKLKKGQKKFTKVQRHYLKTFKSPTSRSLNSAASRIRCQQGNRDRFQHALKRYGTYRGLVRTVLKEAKLPRDIEFLPFVESAYNPKAYSRVGAAGLWQIMPRTARSLGLQLNATIDQRLDPEAATRAAAKYFLNSTSALMATSRAKVPNVSRREVNPFIITSYNYGVAGMQRAVRKFGPDYLTVLDKYRSRSFRVAVRNFYASFLAARHVAKNARKYFGNLVEASPLRYDTVVLRHPISIKRAKKVFRVPEQQLKDLNRALTRYVWHGWRFIPKGYQLRLPPRKDGWRKQIARLNSMAPEFEDWAGTKYRVRTGDTACGIARAFHVKC